MAFRNFATGNGHSFEGKYLEFVPGERIRYTDRFDDPNLPGEMITTVTFKAVLCGTEMNVVQENIPDAIPLEFCYLGWREIAGSPGPTGRARDPGRRLTGTQFFESALGAFGTRGRDVIANGLVVFVTGVLEELVLIVALPGQLRPSTKRSASPDPSPSRCTSRSSAPVRSKRSTILSCVLEARGSMAPAVVPVPALVMLISPLKFVVSTTSVLPSR